MSDWIPFFREKAVFWKVVVRSRIKCANNYRITPDRLSVLLRDRKTYGLIHEQNANGLADGQMEHYLAEQVIILNIHTA
jgi:hypothetical protein